MCVFASERERETNLLPLFVNITHSLTAERI